MVKLSSISTPEHRTTKRKFWMFWWAILYIWTVEIPRFRRMFPILPISSICGHETNTSLPPSFEKEGVSTPRQMVQRSGKDYPVLQSGGRVCPPFLFYRHRPWEWNLALARVLASLTAQERAPVSNSNSGACYVSVLSRPAALPGVSVLSESELAKLQQVLSDACAVAVIAAW